MSKKITKPRKINNKKRVFSDQAREFDHMIINILNATAKIKRIKTSDYIQLNANFIYLLAIFERFIGHLNVHAISKKKSIKDKYLMMFRDLCDDKIRTLKKDLDAWRKYYNKPAKMISDYSIIEKEKSNKKIKNINIIGHSLGGQVAAYVASERTELINNLIMIDTFIRPPGYDPKDHESGPLRMIKYYPDKVSILKRFRLLPSQECLNGWFVRYIAEHSIKETDEGWRWKFDDAMFNGLERLFGYEFTFGCPTLFVYGAESLLMSGNILPNIKKTYSDIMEFEEIADAAHHVFLDKPLEIVDIIKNRLF